VTQYLAFSSFVANVPNLHLISICKVDYIVFRKQLRIWFLTKSFTQRCPPIFLLRAELSMLLSDTLVLTRVKFTRTSQSAASGCVAAAFTIRIKIREPVKGQLRMNVDICLPAEKLGHHGTLYHLHCIAILNSNCSYANK
jgi:hypothetical protein